VEELRYRLCQVGRERSYMVLLLLGSLLENQDLKSLGLARRLSAQNSHREHTACDGNAADLLLTNAGMTGID
jgi:hypothetical protein